MSLGTTLAEQNTRPSWDFFFFFTATGDKALGRPTQNIKRPLRIDVAEII